MACILLWSSAVGVHDSQSYSKKDVTRERISRILELREIFMSFQTGFNHVNAAVVCAILESISGLEPSSVIQVLPVILFSSTSRSIIIVKSRVTPLQTMLYSAAEDCPLHLFDRTHWWSGRTKRRSIHTLRLAMHYVLFTSR